MQSLLVLDVPSMFIYLSGSDLGDSMTDILINENMCSGHQTTLMMVFI